MAEIDDAIKAEQLAMVKYLTLQGWSASRIAARLHICTRTVVRYRRATGCSQPSPHRMTADEIAAAGKLLDDGCSYEEVARTLGVSWSSIVARFPGRSWTPSQVGAFANLHRRFRA